MVATRSYSQYAEQQYILEALGNLPCGKLLDLGAWHATEFSNSRALIESGWDAVLVEPSPEPFLGLLKEYGNNPRVQLVHAAIGAPGFLKMHATADAVSTSDSKVYERWKIDGGYYGSFWTPTFSLADIFYDFGETWDFVSIDVEGSSAEVFTEWLATGKRPQCICLEHDQPTTEKFSDCPVATQARAAGYRELYLNGTNVVYSL